MIININGVVHWILGLMWILISLIFIYDSNAVMHYLMSLTVAMIFFVSGTIMNMQHLSELKIRGMLIEQTDKILLIDAKLDQMEKRINRIKKIHKVKKNGKEKR